MTDGSDRDSAVPWIDDQRARDQAPSASEIEVVSDPEGDTVTFVSRETDRETTTAWITVDAEVVVDIGKQH